MDKKELVLTIASEVFNRMTLPNEIKPLSETHVNKVCDAYKLTVERVEKIYEELK